MKSKRITALLLTTLLAAGLVASSIPASAKGKSKGGPVVVGTDPADDWGSNADPTLQPAGSSAGMELVEATIGMADAKTVNFVMTVAALPPNGGTPEGARYTWDFSVDGGDTMEIDGKWLNYSRGACDPTSGQCPPPRDPGMQPFLVRGNCTVDNTTPVALTICEELAKVQGIFDPAEATITVAVPLEAIGAKPGSKIVGMPGTFGGTISAAPAAFVTNSAMPMDLLITTGTFVVPKK